MNLPRRKVFISHYKGDRVEVDAFIRNFSSVFIPKVLGANNNDDFIDSTNTEYVMQRIRRLYLQDSTVTIVLLGNCTHARRYIDWEIKSSLRAGSNLPNGLMGISLPSTNNKVNLPERFESNWVQGHAHCYAKFWNYPTSTRDLQDWIEDAQESRLTRAYLINNSDGMKRYNGKCKKCGETH
tara:strand:+ start:13849 stop:14394 length:546 start_codon:yes stop_codon:yes gene_type:complete